MYTKCYKKDFNCFLKNICKKKTFFNEYRETAEELTNILKILHKGKEWCSELGNILKECSKSNNSFHYELKFSFYVMSNYADLRECYPPWSA